MATSTVSKACSPGRLRRNHMRSEVYARPDVYDMEYEGASNQDAHFFARLLARARARRVLEFQARDRGVTIAPQSPAIACRASSVVASTNRRGRHQAARAARTACGSRARPGET